MSDVLDDLRDALAGFPGAEAEDLRTVLSAAWTSSSEMLGEIGAAIRRLEASADPLPSPVRQACAKALADIHQVWPSL